MGPRRCVPALALAVAVLVSGVVVPAEAVPFPSVKLIASSDEVDIERFEGAPVFFELGIYLASVGGPFELRVRHPYPEPFKVRQIVPGADEPRKLPASILNGWSGIADFLEV